MVSDVYNVLLCDVETETVLNGWKFGDVHLFGSENIKRPSIGQAWFVWKVEPPQNEFPGDVVVEYVGIVDSKKRKAKQTIQYAGRKNKCIFRYDADGSRFNI